MRRALTIFALAGVLGLAACGDDDEPEAAATPAPTAEEQPAEQPAEEPAEGAAAAPQEGSVAVASPESGALEFDPEQLTATAGTVTFNYSNPSSTPHAFAIDGVDGAVGDTVTGGDAPALEVDLEPGEYEFYCPVGGHRAAGMVGTLTVS